MLTAKLGTRGGASTTDRGRSSPARGLSIRLAVAAVAVSALLVPSQAAALATVGSAEAGSAASSRATITPSARVASLISQMTLDEKFSFVSPSVDPKGLGQAGYIPGVPRLEIPELRLTDGPAGVRLPESATALPVPVALASTFDPALAGDYGKVIAREGRALGQDVALSPMVNIIRVPQSGRNYETFSEDPFVTSRTAAAQIAGIASGGMIPTVKHFALNNQETNRNNVDVQVDDQTLHEVELPGFTAAVGAGAGAVMCSYNKVNGSQACGSDALLNDVLKTQLDFQGWIMSDWGATSAATDLTAGLDQEMRWVGVQPAHFTTELRDAISSGSILESALDDAVARILGQMERFDLLDGAATKRPELNLAPGAKVAQKVAEAGAVLLKNERKALPLTKADRTIALIGPTAKTPKVGGGGSANVVPVSAASPLDTITARAGARTRVSWTTGIPTTGAAIPAASFTPAAPFNASGQVDITPAARSNYSGTLSVPADGDYSFVLDAPQAYATLTIDGTSVAASILTPATGSIHLSAGTHQLSFFAFAATGVPATISLTWITPEAAADARAQAVALAKTVDTPIVFAYDEGTATADRATLTLPAQQDQLIAEVAAANPETIVVLNTGSSITMPWIDDVHAVLDMYFPGQNGAEATARLLYGDVNPSGKLTQTFPVSEDQTPFAGNPEAFPGVNSIETYSEGIYVGYKWYDRTEVTPLFPFGHGLSYTTFDYRGLSAKQRGERLLVSFVMKNTGNRTGQEVAQVYVGPSADVTAPQAVRKLVGFDKVSLRPGQTQRVQVEVDLTQLASWDTPSQSWKLGTGTRTVWVGGSSAGLDLAGKVRIGTPGS